MQSIFIQGFVWILQLSDAKHLQVIVLQSHIVGGTLFVKHCEMTRTTLLKVTCLEKDFSRG